MGAGEVEVEVEVDEFLSTYGSVPTGVCALLVDLLTAALEEEEVDFGVGVAIEAALEDANTAQSGTCSCSTSDTIRPGGV